MMDRDETKRLIKQFEDEYLVNDMVYRICEHLVWVASKENPQLKYFSDRLATSVLVYNHLRQVIESIG